MSTVSFEKYTNVDTFQGADCPICLRDFPGRIYYNLIGRHFDPVVGHSETAHPDARPHIFHQSCLARFIYQAQKCAYCNQKLDDRSVEVLLSENRSAVNILQSIEVQFGLALVCLPIYFVALPSDSSAMGTEFLGGIAKYGAAVVASTISGMIGGFIASKFLDQDIKATFPIAALLTSTFVGAMGQFSNFSTLEITARLALHFFASSKLIDLMLTPSPGAEVRNPTPPRTIVPDPDQKTLLFENPNADAFRNTTPEQKIDLNVKTLATKAAGLAIGIGAFAAIGGTGAVNLATLGLGGAFALAAVGISLYVRKHLKPLNRV